MSKPQGVCRPQGLHLQIDGRVAKAVFNIWSETHVSSYEKKKIRKNITPMMPVKTNNSRLVAEGDLVEHKRIGSTGDGIEWLEELVTEIRYKIRNLPSSKPRIHDMKK